MYIPSQIIVPSDSVVTAKNILSNEFLFRTGIIGDIVSNAIFVFLVLALYRLLKQVNEHQAKLMVALECLPEGSAHKTASLSLYFLVRS